MAGEQGRIGRGRHHRRRKQRSGASCHQRHGGWVGGDNCDSEGCGEHRRVRGVQLTNHLFSFGGGGHIDQCLDDDAAPHEVESDRGIGHVEKGGQGVLQQRLIGGGPGTRGDVES